MTDVHLQMCHSLPGWSSGCPVNHGCPLCEDSLGSGRAWVLVDLADFYVEREWENRMSDRGILKSWKRKREEEKRTYWSTLSTFPKLRDLPTLTEPPCTPAKFSCLEFFLTVFWIEDLTFSRKLCKHACHVLVVITTSHMTLTWLTYSLTLVCLVPLWKLLKAGSSRVRAFLRVEDTTEPSCSSIS